MTSISPRVLSRRKFLCAAGVAGAGALAASALPGNFSALLQQPSMPEPAALSEPPVRIASVLDCIYHGWRLG